MVSANAPLIFPSFYPLIVIRCLANEMMILNSTCRKRMSLQTTIPASQEMVIFQMMSVRTLMRPTQRSAAAKCLMKKFIRDFRPLAMMRAIRTVELPETKQDVRLFDHLAVDEIQPIFYLQQVWVRSNLFSFFFTFLRILVLK